MDVAAGVAKLAARRAPDGPSKLLLARLSCQQASTREEV